MFVAAEAALLVNGGCEEAPVQRCFEDTLLLDLKPVLAEADGSKCAARRPLP